MIIDIKVVLYEEKSVLEKLKNVLENQFSAIVNKDIETLNDIISDIENISKEFATIEMKRRSICSDKDKFINIIEESEDINLQSAYKEVSRLLKNVKEQYDSNELLLRKELMFTKKIMGLMKPNSNNATTYNSNGFIKK